MNKDQAIEQFILLIEVHFPRPRFGGDERREALWMRSIHQILSEFEPDLITKAAEHILRNRDPEKNGGTMFPKPSEILKAVHYLERQNLILELIQEDEKNVQKAIPHQTALPVFTIKRGDPSFDQWLTYIDKQLAQEAERIGFLRASRVWPTHEAVVFEPSQDDQFAMRLRGLPTPRQMPN